MGYCFRLVRARWAAAGSWFKVEASRVWLELTGGSGDGFRVNKDFGSRMVYTVRV